MPVSHPEANPNYQHLSVTLLPYLALTDPDPTDRPSLSSIDWTVSVTSVTPAYSIDSLICNPGSQFLSALRAGKEEREGERGGNIYIEGEGRRK